MNRDQDVEAIVATALRDQADGIHPALPGTDDLRRRGRARRKRHRVAVAGAVAGVVAVAVAVPLLASALPGSDDAVTSPADGAATTPEDSAGRGCPVVAVDLASDSAGGGTERVGVLRSDCEVTEVPSDVTEYHGALSPDGDRMASVSPTGSGSQITVSSIDGTDRRAVFENNTEAGDLDWSPDGSALVFWQQQNGKAVVYVLDVNSMSTRRLTSTTSFSIRPLWDEFGDRIAVLDEQRVRILDIATGESQVVPTEGPVSKMAWSPDGTQMVVTSSPAGSGNPEESASSGSTVSVVDLDGSSAGGSYAVKGFVLDLGWDDRGIIVASASTSPVATLTRLSVPGLDLAGQQVKVNGDPDLG